jgi:hypothetical protein
MVEDLQRIRRDLRVQAVMLVVILLAPPTP